LFAKDARGVHLRRSRTKEKLVLQLRFSEFGAPHASISARADGALRARIVWSGGGVQMPVYEFVCRDCQKSFEVVRPMEKATAGDVKCPACASSRVDRIYSNVYAKTSKKS
jgi:putative FmdB family regulatory protein